MHISTLLFKQNLIDTAKMDIFDILEDLRGTQVDFKDDKFPASQFRATPRPIDKMVLDSLVYHFRILSILLSWLPSLSSLPIQLIRIYLRAV
ncbi:hypothetical protein AVEN_71214-1 [Araneus ventricosus]|uniref:Uncharacterized protein n=1 Tax=Araneus ventricosus TaxID=182803 RepID=A0A4Y2IPE1_ARAVE|nr:hypothetical protein AVEN_71214-1 [Araneus ventricosus]